MTIQEPTTDVNTDEIFIQRCPHDAKNPYTMIRNDLIRNKNISPECRWLLIYLLSNDEEVWNINLTQVMNHLQGHCGQRKVYALVSEALEHGYMKREYIMDGNLKKGVKYYVSETPKFKKVVRNGSFRHVESRDVEKGHLKKDHSLRKPSLKKQHNPQTPETGDPANAGSGVVQPPQTFPEETMQATQEFRAAIVEEKPHYSKRDQFEKWYAPIHEMLTKDKIPKEQIIKVLKWALRDKTKVGDWTGWANKFFQCKNIAQYLRDKFDGVETAMDVKADRKFAPCGDLNESLDKFNEWSKDSL